MGAGPREVSATRESPKNLGLTRFFDRLVRRSFGDLRLPGETIAGYVAALLARFARTDRLYAIRDPAGQPLESVAELLIEARRAWVFDVPDFDPFRERAVRQHIGDYTLFMTGIFREYVDRRARTGFYVREGQRAYRAVADFERAALRPEASLFSALAGEFERYAGALTYMKRVYFHPTDAPPALLRLVTEW